MKSIKLVLLAAVASLAALALAGTASATYLNGGVSGTTIHAQATSGTSHTFKTPDGTVITCTTATAHGTLSNVGTSGSGNVDVFNNVTLAWGANTSPAGNCTESVFGSSVTVTPSCPGGGSIQLGVNWNSGSPSSSLFVPGTCQIDISVPAASCLLRISGTTVAGGTYNPSTGVATYGAAAVPYTRVSGGFGCPASGTGTFMGAYQLDMNVSVAS